jgi:hypothetical protein
MLAIRLLLLFHTVSIHLGIVSADVAEHFPVSSEAFNAKDKEEESLSCQTSSASTSSSSAWQPGMSNHNFLQRLSRRTASCNANEDGKPTTHTEQSSTFDSFFGLFGEAHDTQSELFQTLAQQLFFPSSTTSTINKEEDKDSIAHSEHTNEKSNSDDWWRAFQQGMNFYETMITNMFLQAGTDERREGFWDILRVFTNAFDEVQLHLNETFGEINVMERADLFQVRCATRWS